MTFLYGLYELGVDIYSIHRNNVGDKNNQIELPSQKAIVKSTAVKIVCQNANAVCVLVVNSVYYIMNAVAKSAAK